MAEGEDERRESAGSRAMRGGGAVAATAAAAATPEPAATAAATATRPVGHPPRCRLPDENRPRDEPTERQWPRDARSRPTVSALSPSSSPSARVDVATTPVTLVAGADRGDAQSSERQRAQERGHAAGHAGGQVAAESWKQTEPVAAAFAPRGDRQRQPRTTGGHSRSKQRGDHQQSP